MGTMGRDVRDGRHDGLMGDMGRVGNILVRDEEKKRHVGEERDKGKEKIWKKWTHIDDEEKMGTWGKDGWHGKKMAG